MGVVKAQTGKLFTQQELDAGEDLLQSIQDRLFTPEGIRRFHIDYGSLVTLEGIDGGNIQASIVAALIPDEPRVVSVDFRLGRRSLTVIINGTLEIEL